MLFDGAVSEHTVSTEEQLKNRRLKFSLLKKPGNKNTRRNKRVGLLQNAEYSTLSSLEENVNWKDLAREGLTL